MAFDTVRTNKMRSGLTVLGIVIGITAIVGMTALIRGFDQSVRDLFGDHRPQHDLRPAVRHHRLHQRRRVQGSAQAAQPDRIRRPRARKAGDHSSVRRPRARRRRRPAVQQRVFYRDAEDQAARRPRHLGVLRRRHAHPVPSPAASSTARSCSTARTSSCSAQAVPAAVRGDRDRSDRQDRPGRLRAVRGRRRVRQASVAGRLQPGSRRLRRHSRTRRISASSASAWRASATRHDLALSRSRRCRARASAPRRDGRSPAHHARPPRAQARPAGRFRHVHAGFDPEALRARSARRPSSRSSSSRRSR